MKLTTELISQYSGMIYVPNIYSVYYDLGFDSLLDRMVNSRFPFKDSNILSRLPFPVSFYKRSESNLMLNYLVEPSAPVSDIFIDVELEIEKCKEFLEYYLMNKKELNYTPTFDNLRSDLTYVRSLSEALGKDVVFKRNKIDKIL